MQYKTSFKSGQTIVQFNEDDYYKHKQVFLSSLMESLEKIGGKYTFNLIWEFPMFVAPEVIQEIIHNTCFVCGGLMKDTWASDNVNETHIRKCTDCGHSHT